MHRFTPAMAILLCLSLVTFHAAAAQPAARGGALAESFGEGFENVNDLLARGWVKINNSDTVGRTGWEQGRSAEFPAHQGPPDSFISADFENTDGAGTISNWLLTPEIALRNGTRIEFWTRSVVPDPAVGAFADRLELRLSQSGDSIDVGVSSQSIGEFDTLLESINPNLVEDGYPREWTLYSVTLSGLQAGATGRIALRYYVTDSGPDGSNGDYIGIDSFSVEQPPEPDVALFQDRFEERTEP